MNQNFPTALGWVLIHEGGFVDHPRDPGGPTNQGVTQRVYDGWRRKSGLDTRSVRLIETREVEAIYERDYWDAARCDDLPPGLDYAVFDFAVNSGVSRAVRTLQRLVGVDDDGVIGSITLGAVARQDARRLIEALCADRMVFLRRLAGWPTFGRGWTKRVMGRVDGAQTDDIGVIDRAMYLAASGPVKSAPPAAIPGKGYAPPPEAPPAPWWRALLDAIFGGSR
jgi:lysozyme family protein